ENKEQEGSESEEKEENDNQQDQENKGQTDGEDADEEKEGQSPKPRENKLSPEEAQRLLEALNQQEDQVQEKMKKHKLKGAKVKIEKDW
ncbi:MAG: aerotolerance regulator BatC, partial [Flavobacteriales bacterium]|nr:aerotolerance regulator BatC [Flavobacteriales bacterium]